METHAERKKEGRRSMDQLKRGREVKQKDTESKECQQSREVDWHRERQRRRDRQGKGSIERH